MRKIKNFKVNLRAKDILRSVRKLISTVDMSVELEETIQRCGCFYTRFLSPSVVYDTFLKESLSFVCEKDIPQKWFAKSVFFVTIGSALEEEYKKNESAFGEHTGKIVSVIIAAALKQSKNFMQRIISNEAQYENCEVTKVIDIGNKYYKEICKVISIDKIGISVGEVGTIYPKYSFAGLFYWVPSKRKKPRSNCTICSCRHTSI
ncbi:MAG: hypothetical protein LBR59_00080 [Endomicrobium sp.]|jgi:hypothetical protein|nr:hypothetical protein [Endomicrobium sp.]